MVDDIFSENSNDEAKPTEPTEPTTPEFEKISLKPTEPKKENIPKTEQAQRKIRELLDNGTIELKDKNSKLELNKLVRDQLNLPKGWSSDINKFIKEIAIEKKITISDLGFKNDKIGDMTVNLIKPQTTPQETQIKSNIPSNTNEVNNFIKEKGALPKTGSDDSTTRSQESEPTPKMNPDAQARLIKRGLNDIVAPIYIAMGIVEPDKEEKDEEAKMPTAKKFRADLDGLGDELNKYLVENNMQLPAFMNHIAIVISIFVVLIVPVLKFKLFSSKSDAKPDYEKSVDDIEVKA